MGIRQTLNENPSISIGVTAGIIVIALIIIIWELSGGSHSAATAAPNKAFYSDDDGQTWFSDDSTKVPPYTDSKGKLAVSAKVFKCGNGQPFVLYLQRFTPEGRAKLESSKNPAMASRALGGGMIQMTEVKKPGTRNWVKYTPETAKQFGDITRPTCPNGETSDIEMVLPEK